DKRQREQDEQDFGVDEDQVFQRLPAHHDVGEGGDHQGAYAFADGGAGAAFVPGHRHAFDGHGHDDHREQRDAEADFQAQAVREHADGGHQQHDQDQDGGEARHQQQAQAFKVEAHQQAETHHHHEQRDAGHEGGFTEGQGDKHRHEGAVGLHADQVAQQQHDEGADRHHQ